MKLIFFGSDDFAAINLERLIMSSHDILAVVTQPDRAKGRGLKIGMCPVKELSGRHDIPVLQPKSLRDEYFIKELQEYQADIFIVIAYGKILPLEILNIPKICAVNVHASLLPLYRGAAPINWAIINGDKETGISVIKLNAVMDGGDIVLQRKIVVEDSDTSVTLRAKLAKLGAGCLHEAIDILREDKCPLLKQDEAKVTYARKLTKLHGLIPWEKSAKQIHDMVRGLLPWPSAYTYFNGKLLKILKTEIISEGVSNSLGKYTLTGTSKTFQPAENSFLKNAGSCDDRREEFSCNNRAGTIIDISKAGFVVATGKDALRITRVHLEASKPMEVKDFMAGHKLAIGYCFSNHL